MLLENYLIVTDMYSKRDDMWINGMHSASREHTKEKALYTFQKEVNDYKLMNEKYKGEYTIINDSDDLFTMVSSKEIHHVVLIDNSVEINNL